MAVTRLKSAKPLVVGTAPDVSRTVCDMLERISEGKEAAAIHYAATLDGWTGDIIVPAQQVASAGDRLPADLKDAIGYAYDNIRRFAEAQRASVQDVETELRPGLIAGQKLIPVGAAGCYVPGGRYAHIASALMTVTTARVAGVGDITVASPPRENAIPDAILYAAHLAGATRVLNLGGVQAIAAMAGGLFGAPRADILVGPGNAYVAEAKRQLFGPVGIDMFAGPTDSLVIANAEADAERVAWDLAGQAEHGATSPVWLIALDAGLARQVMDLIPRAIATLPAPNRAVAAQAWRDFGEVILCETREEAAKEADRIAPEHLHVQADDLPWWRDRLSAYGSLFLGTETTVAFGDKAAGPNHVLPTSGAARYTGGLSVHKFLKCVTWQEVRPGAGDDLARATAVISRAEGMEGHARSADLRLSERKGTARQVG